MAEEGVKISELQEATQVETDMFTPVIQGSPVSNYKLSVNTIIDAATSAVGTNLDTRYLRVNGQNAMTGALKLDGNIAILSTFSTAYLQYVDTSQTVQLTNTGTGGITLKSAAQTSANAPIKLSTDYSNIQFESLNGGSVQCLMPFNMTSTNAISFNGSTNTIYAHASYGLFLNGNTANGMRLQTGSGAIDVISNSGALNVNTGTGNIVFTSTGKFTYRGNDVLTTATGVSYDSNGNIDLPTGAKIISSNQDGVDTHLISTQTYPSGWSAVEVGAEEKPLTLSLEVTPEYRDRIGVDIKDNTSGTTVERKEFVAYVSDFHSKTYIADLSADQSSLTFEIDGITIRAVADTISGLMSIYATLPSLQVYVQYELIRAGSDSPYSQRIDNLSPTSTDPQLVNTIQLDIYMKANYYITVPSTNKCYHITAGSNRDRTACFCNVQRFN